MCGNNRILYRYIYGERGIAYLLVLSGRLIIIIYTDIIYLYIIVSERMFARGDREGEKKGTHVDFLYASAGETIIIIIII